MKIAVIPGDGTGPEVTNEAIKVIKAVEPDDHEFNYYDLGGERYLKTGETLPESVLRELEEHDAILLGAIGHPNVKPGILEQGILLAIRFKLDQYINLRPVKLYPGVDCPLKDKKPEDIDFVVIRENTGGIYTGHGGVTQPGSACEIASQVMIYDRATVDRCLEYAFDLKKERNGQSATYAEKPIHLVHKTNVLTYCGDLWKRAFEEMGNAHYPKINRGYAHVDAATMWMVKNPELFDVIVTENMFGDIITDLGAMIQGGMGIAAGGNINPEGVSMFEPIGGSSPKYAGKNIINPLAAISAAAMMLRYAGNVIDVEDADRIDAAVKKAIGEGYIKSLTAGQMGMTTSEVGDLIANFIAKRV